MIQGLLLSGAVLLPALPVSAQSFRADIVRRPPPILATSLGQGHALRKTPPIRPFGYVQSTNLNNPQHRNFQSTTPYASSWVRAGADVNRTFGDYYVDPTVWINNLSRVPTDPQWRNPNNPTNWISTREIRIIIRAPYSPPR